MLRRLRIEFVIITMAIVGSVLFAALGISYFTSYTNQHDLTVATLRQGLEGSFFNDKKMGAPAPDDGELGRMGGFGQLVLVLELDEDGNVVWDNGAPVSIDEAVLAELAHAVVASAAESGECRDLGLAWMVGNSQESGTHIAIVDVTTRDALLKSQLINDVVIFVVTMLFLLALVRSLAGWALKPVEEAWDRQRTFISDASHELKTPLSVIIANTQILQANKTLSQESRRWVDSTADEAAHMKELVNELLELARADESAATGASSAMVREECDLSELVDGAILEFDAVAYERGCTIEAKVAPGITISCDRSWMERAVKIFLDNATKYAAAGSVVRASLAQEGRHVCYSVTNQGQVIDEEDLEHIFDRFYRTDKARQRESSGGFGLGLAIAKGIVEAHGGQISATSSEAEGTTFSFVI